MLLQSIPNPDYMHGTAAMNSRFGLNSVESENCGCNDHYDCGCGGNYKMSVQDCGCGGHGGLDCGCGGYYTMVGTHHGMGYGYDYEQDHDCGCDDDHDCGCGGHHGTMLGRQRATNPNCSCGAMGGTNCSCSYGMGTTGSLGVSLAAPLTRGGFRGEIFDDAPMPSGNWKDAPTPVMLGTEVLDPINTVAEDIEFGYTAWAAENADGTIFDYAHQTWLDSNPNASPQKVAAFDAQYAAFISQFDIGGRYATTEFEYPRDKLLFVLEYVEALTDALDNTYGVGGGGTSAYVGGTTLVGDPTGAFGGDSEDSVDPYAQRTTSTGAGKALLLGAVGIGLIGFFDLY